MLGGKAAEVRRSSYNTGRDLQYNSRKSRRTSRKDQKSTPIFRLGRLAAKAPSLIPRKERADSAMIGTLSKIIFGAKIEIGGRFRDQAERKPCGRKVFICAVPRADNQFHKQSSLIGALAGR